MRALLTILFVIVSASVAWADKQVQPIDNPIDRVECPFENVAYDWNFHYGNDHGFTTGPCDDGGLPVWEYGLYYVIWFWATGITGGYPNEAGDSLISPSFVVDDSSYLVEIGHIYTVRCQTEPESLLKN